VSKHRALVYGQPVPQDFFDAMQEFLGTMVSRSLALTMVPGSANQVQIVAGVGSAQIGIGIDGLWRYISATTQTAVTGGAGTYDIFVTATDNSFSVNPSPPPPELDATNYAFALATPLLQGNTPAAAHFRKVGEAIFDGTRVLNLRQTIGADGAQLAQPGDVKMSAASSPSAGWLLCNGQAVSRTTYAALYAALGGTGSPFGQGDGSSTFNVPDLRSRFPIGAGQGSGLTNRPLGQTGGAETAVADLAPHTHTYSGQTGTESAAHVHTGTTDGDSPDHSHHLTLSSFNSPVNQAGGQGCATLGGGSDTGGASARHSHTFTTSGENVAHSHAFSGTTSTTGAGGGHANMPPWSAVNYFIKT
jgi:microcystin-dependent protein